MEENENKIISGAKFGLRSGKLKQVRFAIGLLLLWLLVYLAVYFKFLK
jgi:hypothetical protein